MGEVGHDLQEGSNSNHFGLRLPSNLACMFTCKSGFCKEMFLYTSALTQRWASAQRWLRKKNDFTKGCFYTQVLLHRGFQQRDAFTHRCFRKQILLHRDYFEKNRRRHVFTQVPLHRYAFTHSRFYAVLSRTSSFAQRFF